MIKIDILILALMILLLNQIKVLNGLSISGTISGSVTTNDTTCIGKVNATTNLSATITATTVGGQKLEVYCVAVVN